MATCHSKCPIHPQTHRTQQNKNFVAFAVDMCYNIANSKLLTGFRAFIAIHTDLFRSSHRPKANFSPYLFRRI